jgi:flagellar motility protein MotE (MotC chaperone)
MYLCVGKRIIEVEEQLSKVEEKKKRDLENLKKQNERIAVMQVGSGYGIHRTILCIH